MKTIDSLENVIEKKIVCVVAMICVGIFPLFVGVISGISLISYMGILFFAIFVVGFAYYSSKEDELERIRKDGQ